MEKKIIKAAIYTRKSSEEGLDMAFNSLDAQREACAAYILSQKHEGWILVDKYYSDGGISGGTLNRPALQILLEDIKNGLVDIIVVYKIDRLTRSLHDFSKLVDIFDKHQTSFVSITQQFNTSTSMGRLTLNMLLSFAQFEREVTGERIRDKKLATAQKGMWLSGAAPFGYKLGYSNSDDIHVESEFRHRASKKLVPNGGEVQKLRRIFLLYTELRSTGKLKDRLKEEEITTRSGKPWLVGALNNMLRRKTYLGKIEHKGKVYEGQHEAILSQELFDEVQEIRKNNLKHHNIKTLAKEPSLLAGKVFDDKGFAMSPSHSTKKGKRYRYYLSQAYIQRKKEEAGSLPQIPAQDIEDFLSKEIKDYLGSALQHDHYNLDYYKELRKHLDSFLSAWDNCSREVRAFIIRTILRKIIISVESVKIELSQSDGRGLAEWIGLNKDPLDYESVEEKEILAIEKSLCHRRVRRASILIIGEQFQDENRTLIEAIKQSFALNERLLQGEGVEDLQKELNVNPRRLDRILFLRFLAPDIIRQVLEYRQPGHWTTALLYNCYTFDWAKQREYFHIS